MPKCYFYTSEKDRPVFESALKATFEKHGLRNYNYHCREKENNDDFVKHEFEYNSLLPDVLIEVGIVYIYLKNGYDA